MALPPTDPDLVRAAAGGDDDAWELLLTLWLPVVLGWCRRFASPGMDAEDLAHDAWIKVYDRLHQLREPAAFSGWLYQVTKDTIRKKRERSQRWTGVLQALPDARPHAPDTRDVHAEAAVLRLLDALPDEQREVLVLCLVEERTREEVAELLSVPTGTIKSRLRLGTDRFRKLAEADGLLSSLQEVAGWTASTT